MWAKILLNKWVLSSAALVLSVFLVWNTGRSYGYDAGFAKAEEVYVSQVQDAILNTVTDRDLTWQQDIGRIFEDLQDVINKNNNTDQLERELSRNLDQIGRRLEEINRSIPTANLGGCNLTPEFDSLLDDRERTPNP